MFHAKLFIFQTKLSGMLKAENKQQLLFERTT